MKFIDEATITVEAGNGGAGALSFWREKFVALGGPDGGNGGAGGSVIVVGDRNKQTLLDFRFQPRWKAADGKRGDGGRRDGLSGDDLIIPVPIGTQILRADDKSLVADIAADGQRVVIAKGGRGGKGNDFFKSPTNQVPEHTQPGEKGERGSFTLSLKLFADVGLIGFPNAGKSTLISRISAARPKIADYPFTTLEPNLGVVQTTGLSFVVADIPGLIPGASEGRGLGIQFLKHVERTRVLVHLIDPMQLDDQGEPVPITSSFELINHELKNYSETLAAEPQIVLLTKLDALSDEQLAMAQSAQTEFAARGLPCFLISAVSGAGLKEFLEFLAKQIRK